MGFTVNVRTNENKSVGITRRDDALELSALSGIVGVIPGFNPPVPPLPKPGVFVVGVTVVGLFVDVVVGVDAPAVLQKWAILTC